MGKFSTLERAELTKDWALEDRAALAHFLEKQNLKQGENLFFEKAAEQKLYFVDSGSLKLQTGSIQVELGPGQSLGELSLLFPTSKQTSSLALEDCQFWVITEEKWRDLRKRMPQLALLLVESINRKLASLLTEATLPPKMSELISPKPTDTELL